MHACPICTSDNIHLFIQGIYDSETTNVMECSNCGLQFLSPLMTEQEEDEYYNGYYRKQQNRHFKSMQLADLQKQAFLHYEQYRDVYMQLISNSNSILEIGSGTGGFLRFLHEYHPNANVTSIERCEENVDFIRKSFSNVQVKDDLANLEGKRFDCVVAFGVFEHVRNSREFLADIRGCLKDEGQLALNVPNKNNALVYAYGLEEFKKFTYMKQHYYTFTEEAFYLLAEQAGYSVDRFNYMQVWGLDNHLSWLRYRKPRDFNDMSSIISKGTAESYNHDLIEKKMTDLFMAVLVPLYNSEKS